MNQPHPSIARRALSLRSSAVRDLLRDAQTPGMISLAGGLPAAELFDVEGIALASQTVLEQFGQRALQYGLTEGHGALREQVAQLMRARGAQTPWQNVLITTGSQQALDLIVRTLAEPGDSIAASEPTYLAALQVFALNDVDVVPLELSNVATASPMPTLAYVVTNFANPTGETWTLAARRELLHWAVRNRVFVVEDDPYGELRFSGEHVPPLIELARAIPGASDWCCYVSTLSKIVAPGLRIGWLVAPERLLGALIRAKQTTDLQTATLTQYVAARYLESGALPSRIDTQRRVYRERKDALAHALREQLGGRASFRDPEGGMFLWAHLSHDIDTQKLLARARAEGVIFVPGAAFYARKPASNTLRLSFVTVDEKQIAEGVTRLVRAIAAYDP